MTVFEDLNALNVNDYTEERDGLTYLTWCKAWAEVMKKYPGCTYEIQKFNGLPYVFDANTGYMVYTTVTIEGVTREMWLPVMNSNNKAMKDCAYTYKTKSGERTVEAATMFDINKTIMRCLVKNLAMFGLGLYIYAGEDLPEVEAVAEKERIDNLSKPVTPEEKVELLKEMNRTGMKKEELLKWAKVKEIDDITNAQFLTTMKQLKTFPTAEASK